MKLRLLAAVLCVTVSNQAVAGGLAVWPVQVGNETARFVQGVATLDLETEGGAVQITPLPFDHGSLSFDVAVFNKGAQPANFDIDNIRLEAGAQVLAVLSKDQLEAKAKSRAMWSQIGVAMLAGAAAAAAASAKTTNTYRSRYVTPRGVYSHTSTFTDNSIGTVGAVASVAAGTAGVVSIQQRLDRTVADLNEEIVQKTTVDPDSGYAGRIVVEKIKDRKLPQQVRMIVNWNGVAYPFAFQIGKIGSPPPPPFKVAERAVAAQAVSVPDSAPPPKALPAEGGTPAGPADAPPTTPTT